MRIKENRKPVLPESEPRPGTPGLTPPDASTEMDAGGVPSEGQPGALQTAGCQVRSLFRGSSWAQRDSPQKEEALC